MSREVTSHVAGLPKVANLFLSDDTNKICKSRRRRLYFNPILYSERIKMSSHRAVPANDLSLYNRDTIELLLCGADPSAYIIRTTSDQLSLT